MHQDPEHYDYDDDEFNFHPHNKKSYPKKYDIDWSSWEYWVSDMVKKIVEEDNNIWSFSVSDLPLNDNTNKLSKSYVFLGNNFYGEQVWKLPYFSKQEIDIQYRNHIVSHAKHFVSQPSYYKGLFDILN